MFAEENTRQLRIVVSGTSGFIGQHLLPFFQARGHEIVQLVRAHDRAGIFWDPEADELDAAALGHVDAVVHLAGETVAERWTAQKKDRILQSRVQGTSLLARTVAGLETKPKVMISASAIGYYGDRGPEVLTEQSPPGRTYLARVCQEWEHALHYASDAGIRTASTRFGIVFSNDGGAFPKMCAPFRNGIGGRLGSGKQYMSWIHLSDALSAIEFILSNDSMSGGIDVCSPNPCTNDQFTRELSRILHRPAFFPVPMKMVELTFGHEMAAEVLLASDRCVPKKLMDAGFQFKYPELYECLRALVHR